MCKVTYESPKLEEVPHFQSLKERSMSPQKSKVTFDINFVFLKLASHMYWFISQVIEFKDNIQRVMNENSVIKAIINQMILNSNENQNKMYEL